MKFSFVNAAASADIDAREGRKSIGSWPPLGILYIASFLQRAGVEVSVLDQAAKRLSMEETVRWIKKEKPEILGFSTLATSGRTAAMISDIVKREDPNLTVVFGNYFATFNPRRVLEKYPSVDVVVRGEGEHTAAHLVECLRKKGNLKTVEGISFRTENGVVSTPDRPLVKDLDSLPFPNRSLLGEDYHSVIAGANVAPKKFTSIVSSRGCFYRCRFCSCTQFARNTWRPRSVENTLEELHLLASEGYKQFIFVDDSFTANPKNVIKLCRRMRKEKIDMEWICEGRVDRSSYEMIFEIAKAGCKILYFGIESANQRILDYYNKRITPEQSENAVKKARRAGMDVVVGSFIVGAPDETREEIQNTINFANKIPIDMPQFNILGVYPGTEIWKEMEAKGLLKGEEHWETGIAVAKICPTAVPYNEIRQMVHDGFYRFVRRPSFVSSELVRTIRSSYRLRTLINNLTRLGAIRENLRFVT